MVDNEEKKKNLAIDAETLLDSELHEIKGGYSCESGCLTSCSNGCSQKRQS